ncbi:MAG: DUF1553 domain-containing protein [Planctomycetes bacterium]|nr:DUF1553 domain-containing protein [Planctomycetota bacterium]
MWISNSLKPLLLLLLPLAFFSASAQEKRPADSKPWWSLQPIVKPAVPPIANDKYKSWPRNPIDNFVLAKLLDKGMAPAREADGRTLIRRVYFDLIGLPPTPEEIDAFEKDQAAGAYEKVVDRLLASPRHGERWARHWMDVIHFAETHGHDQDVPRPNAWPYRDYLIQSFNSDKPYSRFVEEQLAADVLFPDQPQLVVALGFLAAGPWDESSLRDIREDSIDRKAGQYLDRDDMLGTVFSAFLSTTLQCARCHDHKFDPIPQKEYYSLQAVFAGVDRANRAYDEDPQLHSRRARLRILQNQLKAGPKSVGPLLNDPALAGAVALWEKDQRNPRDIWKALDPSTFKSAGGATPVKQPDLSIRFEGKKPDKDTYVIKADCQEKSIVAVRLEVLGDEALPFGGPGRQDNGNLHLSEFQVAVAGAEKPLAIARAIADFNQDGWDITKALDGKKETAWGIYPMVGQTHAAIFVFEKPVPGPARLVFTLDQQHGGGHLIGRPRLSVTSETPPASIEILHPRAQRALAKPQAERTEQEKLDIAYFAIRAKVENDLLTMPAPKLVYAAASDFQPDGSFKPAGGCRAVHILKRGDITRPGAEAKPGVLSCVTGPRFTTNGAIRTPDEDGRRRAAFAKWVSDPQNPLTWRSIVNRVWHYHFGRGIVSTPSDFGRMGATPSHPELLDWLAAEFLGAAAPLAPGGRGAGGEGEITRGSLKKLHRLIVTSATYRQAVRHDSEYAKIDADNALLWRANRQRLDVESIRDAVLQIGGKLDLTMSGLSVKLFVQSPGIHRTPKVDYLSFDPDSPGAYRRSIYRFIFRTVPDPFMDALDCPDASQFTPVRAQSITALQALALLNDPFLVRMSEHFAKRLEAEKTPEDQVRRAFLLTLGRQPSERETASLAEYARRHGLANACRVLFNTNEFLFVN